MKGIVGEQHEWKSEQDIGPPRHFERIGVGRHGWVDPLDFFHLSTPCQVLVDRLGRFFGYGIFIVFVFNFVIFGTHGQSRQDTNTFSRRRCRRPRCRRGDNSERMYRGRKGSRQCHEKEEEEEETVETERHRVVVCTE